MCFARASCHHCMTMFIFRCVSFADAYKLPQGVFLFLGYSETDEALLKPHSNLTVRDAVGSLEEFMHHELTNKVSLCDITSIMFGL